MSIFFYTNAVSHCSRGFQRVSVTLFRRQQQCVSVLESASCCWCVCQQHALIDIRHRYHRPCRRALGSVRYLFLLRYRRQADQCDRNNSTYTPGYFRLVCRGTFICPPESFLSVANKFTWNSRVSACLPVRAGCRQKRTRSDCSGHIKPTGW